MKVRMLSGAAAGMIVASFLFASAAYAATETSGKEVSASGYLESSLTENSLSDYTAASSESTTSSVGSATIESDAETTATVDSEIATDTSTTAEVTTETEASSEEGIAKTDSTVEEAPVETTAAYSVGPWIKDNRYVTVLSKDVAIIKNFNKTNPMTGTLQAYQGKTLKATGQYEVRDGEETAIYLSLYDYSGNWVGYAKESDIKNWISNDAQGKWQKYSGYLTINNGGYVLWSSFKWNEISKTSKIMGKTYTINGMYKHYNGSTYYSLYDGKGNWVGYVNSLTGGLADGPQGLWQKENTYVTVVKRYNVYSDINKQWKIVLNEGASLNKTYRVTGKYGHVGGSTYYSLYDQNNKWIGYINEAATKRASKEQGVWLAQSGIVSIAKPNYIFSDIDKKWATAVKGTNAVKNTYIVNGKYAHLNGSIYYSLYTSGGKWVGYVNSSATIPVKDQRGVYQARNLIVTVTSKYTIYSDLTGPWKTKISAQNALGKTYRAEAQYNHANGAKYYSLYDGNNKWVGYINTAGVTTAADSGGVWQSMNQKVKVSKKNYTLWQTFDFKKSLGSTTSIYGNQYKVTGKYVHLNGSTYYSLYNSSNKWLGYVNSQAVSAVSDVPPVDNTLWTKATGGVQPNLSGRKNIRIEVSIAKQRVYIYDSTGLIYTMVCSTGLPGGTATPTGNFAIQAEKGLSFGGSLGGARYWRSFLGHGVYLFHSVPINGSGNYILSEAYKLGQRASHGCIRLSVPDAIWFYYGIPYNTPVKIY